MKKYLFTILLGLCLLPSLSFAEDTYYPNCASVNVSGGGATNFNGDYTWTPTFFVNVSGSSGTYGAYLRNSGGVNYYFTPHRSFGNYWVITDGLTQDAYRNDSHSCVTSDCTIWTNTYELGDQSPIPTITCNDSVTPPISTTTVATSTNAILMSNAVGLDIIIVLLFVIVIGFIFNNLDLKAKSKPWSH